MSGKRVDHPSHRGKRPREQAPFLGSFPDAGLERLQDLLLAPCPHPGELPEPALLRCGLEAVEGRDAELHPDARGGLRADTRQAQEVDDPGRNEPAALRQRVHLAVLDDLDDLALDRLADPGQLLRLAVERELRDRQRRLADPARGASGRRSP